MHLNLKLSPEQETELLDLAGRFHLELENSNAPFPKAATLSQLKEKLKAILFEQDGFEGIWEQSRTKSQLLTLTHQNILIRNLPWQIVTEERNLLTIAKSHKQQIPVFQPSVALPLKVLVMVSAPEGVTRLDYEGEELKLLRAFAPLIARGEVQVHFTDDGSLENLQEKLEENKFHILHFSGHGLYKDGIGTLALENPENGQLAMVNAEQFNAVLAKVGEIGHRPDLIILSACQTAQAEENTDLSGVADTLLDGGTPAVIAMSASILDTCAIQFAETFYGRLSKGYPLTSAFREGRFAIRTFESNQNLAQYGLAPGQWLIPQLLLNDLVEDLIDKNAPKETLDFSSIVEIIEGDNTLVDLRVRPENYVFIGRRKEKRIAQQVLKKGKAILLRGQGGVGKTALAEHLAIRQLVANPRTKVFTLSEKTPSAQSLLDQMSHYLTKEKNYFSIVSELALIEKQIDKFYHLLAKISSFCEPIFLFDNVESFQVYDQEQNQWIWNAGKHIDIYEVLQILHQSTRFPILITGRYPLVELQGLEVCNMNTVPFSDFYRKCFQLQFSELKSIDYSSDASVI